MQVFEDHIELSLLPEGLVFHHLEVAVVLYEAGPEFHPVLWTLDLTELH